MGVGEVAVSEPAQSEAAWEYASDVQVGFVDVDGVGRLGSLARCWDEPFERAAPVRRFIAFEGQKNFTGEYWAASSRDLVGYESWVERDAAMALDMARAQGLTRARVPPRRSSLQWGRRGPPAPCGR